MKIKVIVYKLANLISLLAQITFKAKRLVLQNNYILNIIQNQAKE